MSRDLLAPRMPPPRYRSSWGADRVPSRICHGDAPLQIHPSREMEETMKSILIVSIASFGLATAAFAQSANSPDMARPNDFWKRMHLPDAILPSPCGVGAMRVIVASADAPTSPHSSSAARLDGVRLIDYQCAGNSRPHPDSAVPPAPRSSAK